MASGKVTAKSGLFMREQPAKSGTKITLLPTGTLLEILDTTNGWHHVRASGKTGYVSAEYVALMPLAPPSPDMPTPAPPPAPAVVAATDSRYLKDDAVLLAIPMEAAPRMQAPGADPSDKQMARIWNSYGGLLTAIAHRLHGSPAMGAAVLQVESGGGFYVAGMLKIRFENHHFWRHWGKLHPAQFAEAFRFNTSKTWTGHKCRLPGGEWADVHTNQSREWAVFDYASRLNRNAALKSISMGGPQILGANCAGIGYSTPELMYDAFVASERAQILALFDFINGHVLTAYQSQDFNRFASGYNGSKNVAVYGPRLAQATRSCEQLVI